MLSASSDPTQKTYSCGICKTTPSQISHHKSHIDTQKHKDKRELFELKLSKLSPDELAAMYGEIAASISIDDIVKQIETVIYTPVAKANKYPIQNKKLKQPLAQSLEVTPTMSAASVTQHNISNKEALKDKIHEIHNYLRNNGAGYGMNALKVFNIIYGLKKIEENGLIDKVGLKTPECEFSYLLKLANEDQGERLAELIFGAVLDSINSSKLRDILFYEIPRNIRGRVLVYLIKEIDTLTMIEQTCNVLLSGKIYEYFIGRDESAISELGAYFTDRHIVEYALQKLNPTMRPDGSIPTMIDMFGGSGGFTTGYINYMNDKYPRAINWETELHKVSHYDMNEDVIRSAGLEFFCLTGVLPMSKNLKYKNSFADEFSDDLIPRKTYDYIITNPPYGGDKINRSDAQLKREKVREYIKAELTTCADDELRARRMSQLKALDASDKHEKQDADKMRVSLPSCSGRIQKFAYDNKLKGTDKEACSLMLIMDMLAPGGTAIGVLKEGVFFNRTYKDMRRCLVEKYRVREVISVPQDQFENTSTKTSIIIFDNAADGETTREVVFRDLTVERYDADKFAEVMGEIVIVENRGDIKGISDVVISTATRDELLASSICSLNGKDYSKKEMTAGTDYEMVKLGDICEFMPKSKRNASFGKLGGAFNFYTSSDKVQKCSVADYNEECLIIGSGGTANIKMDNCFSCSADNFIIKSPKYLQYLYYLFKGNMDLLKDGFSGSVLKHISKDYLTNLKIPIPKSAEKLDEWTIKLEHAHKEKCKCVDNIDLATSSVNKYVENLIIGEPFEEVELGTLIDTKSGGYITKSNMESGIYPVYGGGNISNYINIYNRENELIINKDGVSIDCVKYVRDKFFLNHHGWTLTYKTTFYKNYINRWLINHQIELFNLATGSAQKGINKDNFLKMKIQLPINMYKLKGLDDMCTELDKYYDALKLSNNTYNGFINELMQEAMPNCASISTNKAAFTITPPLQPLLEGSLNTHTLDDAKTLPVIIKKKKQIKV